MSPTRIRSAHISYELDGDRNTILTVFSTVYRSVGFADDALLINSINSVMGILGQVACVLFLDKVGRRIPLVGGNIMSGCMFIGAT